ncbi:CLAVATA3/ESR (CLE)-related protein 12-like [Macadamia integrifolia]|uniref:CLAVATA3/ESR (CLE)-related protein 12-like n=1 Tax=Macadamia integrifolia TaxID=60698 RepID=UPI001C5001F0|nr:CLAVATA3/ESR (CLE)-related protein 12-like [Macadamia integrifolia]
MALRSQQLLGIILWLSLLFLLLFHGLHNTRSSKTINHHPFLYQHTLQNRKVLASKFDFSPFKRRHPYVVVQPEPAESEIDPRYGVQKRIVPTGPNPLHH